MNRLQKRASWALTLYFGFLLFLLLWGRIESAPLCHAGNGAGLWQEAHQARAILKSAASCPACDRQGPGGLPIAAMAAALAPAKHELPSFSPDPARLPFTTALVADPRLSRLPPHCGVDPALNSLRTVVLLI